MSQATLVKFDYPNSLVKSYQYWHVLLRPAQPTLGALILICKENVEQYSAISAGAAAEQMQVVADIERVLKERFNYSKINYLMLMMVDPAVHFHVIPRYESGVNFNGCEYLDNKWPTPPSLQDELQLSESVRVQLLQLLRNDFGA